MTKVKQFPDQSGKKTDDKKTRNNEKRADDSLLMSLSGGGGAGGFRSADADGVGDDDDAYDDGQSGEELYDGEAGANDDYESGEEPDDSEAGGYDKGESGEELYDGEADDYDDYESGEKSDDGEAGDYDDDESGEADFSDKKKTSVKDVKKADTITFNPRRLRAKNGRSVRDPEDSGDELSYDEKIKQYRAMVWRIRSILVVLAAVVIVLAAMFVSNRHFSRAELIPVREFASEDGASCISFADYILQYGPNGATCADKDGRVKWSITYEMDQPILDISGNIAAIADYGGRTIYVMNTAKQLYSVTTSLPIHKVSASESGEVAEDKTEWEFSSRFLFRFAKEAKVTANENMLTIQKSFGFIFYVVLNMSKSAPVTLDIRDIKSVIVKESYSVWAGVFFLFALACLGKDKFAAAIIFAIIGYVELKYTKFIISYSGGTIEFGDSNSRTAEGIQSFLAYIRKFNPNCIQQ